MSRKLKLEDVLEYYKLHGCELLEDKYIKNSVPMKFKCKCGEIDSKAFNHFKRSNCCRKCAKEKQNEKSRLNIDNVIKVIENKGLKLISGIYENNTSKLIVECNEGHRYETYFYLIQKAKGCPKCSGVRKYTFDEVKEIFESQNCTLLEVSYENANKRMKYKCKCGFEGKISLAKFLNRKKGCVHCCQTEKDFTYKEYTADELISEFWRYYDENNMYPRSSDMRIEKGYPSVSLYYKHFYTWNNFLQNIVCVMGENDWYICDEEILRTNYFNSPKELIINSLMVKRKWEAIIKKANSMGLKRNIHSRDKEFYSKNSLIEYFWKYYREYKKFPRVCDYDSLKDYPSSLSIQRHFGGWDNYLKEVGVVDRNTTDGWYIHDEALLRKYYPYNKIEEIIAKLMIKRIEATIRMKANSMGLKILHGVRYIPKYRNDETRNKLISEAIAFYSKFNRSPYTYELTLVENPRNAISQNWDSYNEFLEECKLPIFRREVMLETKDDGILFLQNLKNLLGRNPFVTELDKYGLNKSWFARVFGSFKDALYQANLIGIEDISDQVKIDNSIEGLRSLYKKLNRVPNFTEYKDYATQNNLFHPNTLISKINVKSYVDLCRDTLGESNRVEYDENELIENLFVLKDKLDRVPMGKELAENGYPSLYVYKYFFNKRYFNDIIRDLGWEPTGQDSFYKTDEELLFDYLMLFEELGRVPLRDDIDESESMCHSATYISRFNSISNVCEILDINYNELIIDSSMGSGTSCFDKNGEICRSIPEMKVTNMLIANNIKYIKEYSYSNIIKNDRRRFDWYLPELDLYIEYFGLFNKNRIDSEGWDGIYTRKSLKKIDDCFNFNINLIDLYPTDLKNNFKKLMIELNKYAKLSLVV